MTAARRWIVACVLAGFALRLGFACLYWTGQPLTHDEREYLALARSIVRGDGFRYPADEPAPGTGQRFGRAPGYPAFLALLAVSEPAASTPLRVKIAQSAVGAVGIWLIAALAGRTAGPRGAVLAAAIAAIYPPLVWMPAYALSETLYSTLALGSALALEKGTTAFFRKKREQPTVLAGLLTGAAILVRPATLAFLPLAFVWLWRQARTVALLYVAIALAVVAPWTIRNVRVYGHFVAVATEGGVTFWTGNHPLARGEGDLAANPDLKAADLEFRTAHAGLNADELEAAYYRDAFEWIRTHPLAWASLLARKALFTLVPIGPSYRLHSTRYFYASVVSYALLLPAALAGVWRLRAAPHRPVALWLMAASTIIVGLLFFPQERFRIPVIDPALIVTAAALAGCSADERTRRRPDV